MVTQPARLRAVSPPADAALARPRLDLSAAALEEALSALVHGSEPLGGIERYVEALKAKAALYADAFNGGAEALTRQDFLQLCAFMPTVRRRIAPYVDEPGFVAMREGLARLLDGDALTSDARIAAFCARYPQDREHRFVRDIAAEVLHNVYPEAYPLMTRWVWDVKTGSGVLRELWHGDGDQFGEIRVPDSYATFLMLREELAQYLTDNGVYRDVAVLCRFALRAGLRQLHLLAGRRLSAHRFLRRRGPHAAHAPDAGARRRARRAPTARA